MKLNVKAFALAGGTLWAAAAFLLALTALWFDWGTEFVDLIGTIYIGYEATVVGALVGAIWGFVDVGIACVVFAWLYNLTIEKCGCVDKKKK
jgi:hypothetical protein